MRRLLGEVQYLCHFVYYALTARQIPDTRYPLMGATHLFRGFLVFGKRFADLFVYLTGLGFVVNRRLFN